MKTLIKFLAICVLCLVLDSCCNVSAQTTSSGMYQFTTVRGGTVYRERDLMNGTVVYVLIDRQGKFIGITSATR